MEMEPSIKKEKEIFKLKKKTSRKYLLLGSGILLAIVGFALGLSWCAIFQKILENELKLTPKARYYSLWQNMTVPLSLDFYFFNLTNPKEMIELGEKPSFQELGPYRFRERKEKVNVVFHKNNTVTFQQVRYWYFDEKGTNGTYDDIITTLNMVPLSAAFVSRNWRSLTKFSVNMMLKTQNLFIQHSVREMLFDGYEDGLLTLAKGLNIFGGMPVTYDKFGWFYKRNGSELFEGKFNMHTGADDISQLGKLKFWNDMTEMPFYNKPCSDINGVAGEIWTPGTKKEQHLSFFSPDLCRSVNLEYTQEDNLFGIRGLRFDVPVTLFDNGTIDPVNKCTCTGDCVPIGLFNVSTCRHGAPAFVSLPHFYQADPYYLQSVKGLSPNKEKHSFFMTFEPTTSIPLEGAARLQLNALLQPIPDFSLYRNVSRVFFPLLWFEQHVVLPEDLAYQLGIMLWMPTIGTCLGFVISAVGLFMTGCALWMIFKPAISGSNESNTKRQSNTISTTIKEIQPLVRKEPKNFSSTNA